MNSYLLLIVAVIYIVQTAQFVYQHQYGLALAFLCYAISNVGFFYAARGI